MSGGEKLGLSSYGAESTSQTFHHHHHHLDTSLFATGYPTIPPSHMLAYQRFLQNSTQHSTGPALLLTPHRHPPNLKNIISPGQHRSSNELFQINGDANAYAALNAAYYVQQSNPTPTSSSQINIGSNLSSLPDMTPAQRTPSSTHSQATNFSDLLRFTVTVSSVPPKHTAQDNTPHHSASANDNSRDDVSVSDQFSRGLWVDHQPSSALNPDQHSTWGSTPSVTTQAATQQEAYPLVQSVRAIEAAVANGDRGALKKAVSQLASAMVVKEHQPHLDAYLGDTHHNEPASPGASPMLKPHIKSFQSKGNVTHGSAGVTASEWSAANASNHRGSFDGASDPLILARLLLTLQQLSSAQDDGRSDEAFQMPNMSSQRASISPSDKDNSLVAGVDTEDTLPCPPGLDRPLTRKGTMNQTSNQPHPERPEQSASLEEPKITSLSHKQTQTPASKERDKMERAKAADEQALIMNMCKGNVLTLTLKDQATCRTLQKHLQETTPESRAAILKEALPHFVRLMTDPIGNYFCQTVVQVASPEDLKKLLDRVWKQLPSMSKSLYGTRAVQRLVERCGPLYAKKLLKAFAGHFHDLAVDACGSHVVRQILESIPAEHAEVVHGEIRSNVLEISMTKRGCCAVQKCLDCCTEQQRHLLVTRILEHIPQLIQDPFGNYVIQHVLNLKDPRLNSQVIEYVLIDLWYLSKHKFASNVVERCVRLSDCYQLGSIMGSLVSLGVRKVRELLEDSFGNYVIQSVLETVPHDTFGPLDRVVAFCLPDLNQTAHGRRIAQILLAKFPFLAETPKLYHEGKARPLDQTTDSSNGQTSDNSMEPRSSTENSNDRSSSSSCSKGNTTEQGTSTGTGGDKSKSGGETSDRSRLSELSPGAPEDGSHTSQMISIRPSTAPGDTSNTDSTPAIGAKRLSPHNLSLAINRFRNSRRHVSNIASNPSHLDTASLLEASGGLPCAPVCGSATSLVERCSSPRND
eukprot:Blabericola_migrator_1__3388@NODE_1_length_33786_cov_123_788665_g0_i0_p2_GENE_NODE_1_length_33786_cov_123_788665_g0_i0NODE_1_length_33786_cov_123_788665_g0_i0_p2_ORF_typecomplete_len977_score135_10PUF/PF00806_19/1_9e03PUF/PF00806_19/1_5e05PUF/PF00806_19/0_56PUF/PF00806_19/0_3PUF/PF00806_19/1_2e07PUF/PF00806_19/1_1e07PUF/PF00806_19/0_19PUF/PF00806_19/0_0088CPL/PF08144_11/4_6e03CPL/PF08144_11/0_46CPL/PF08144_11/15Herpes_BBRF1/PF04793_12/0_054Herpes_BBRF1/PF04793_12/2_6e03FCD/PF07729_12/2_6e02FCD/P